MHKPTGFLWVDLEMTGLNPKEDLIIEIAAIATDEKLVELDSMHSVIRQPMDKIVSRLKSGVWYNWSGGKKTVVGSTYDMALKNGLLDKISNGQTEQKVKEEFLNFIKKNFSVLPILAGNSIHQDKRFLEEQWPEVIDLIHYRMLDVSSYKVWWIANGSPEYKKKEMHRALDDIRESIAELKHYSANINFND